MTGLRVSLNEVLRLSRRVFLALGAGPGCEHEPAQAVAWLESRGLPGLSMLARECQAARRAARATTRETVEDAVTKLRMDGGGAGGAWIAAAAVDWLVASGESCAVTVDAVRSPLWFIPDLAARGKEMSGWMEAWAAGGDLLFAATVDEGGPSLRFGCTPRELADCDATVSLGRGRVQQVGPAASLALGPEELDARYERSLSVGIPVDEPSWNSLYSVARGALVPETAASRARGAGAAPDRS